jgi:hypothetical protein
MSVELRYASLGEYPRIREFLTSYWSAANIYVREPKLFDWTFARQELWDRDGYSFALAEDKGNITGILGGIPFIMNCFGQSFPALWLANYMISPDYRRGPLAVQLLKMMRRAPYEATVAFGISPRTAPIYQVLRWKVLDNIPRHFALLPQASERMCELLRLAHDDWPRERAESLVAGFKLPNFPGEKAESDSHLPANWNAIGWNPIAQQTAGAARNAEYLKWRYLDHPHFAYRLIVIHENGRAGLIVWRLETIRVKTEAGEENFDRIGRVVEFLPASRQNAQALFRQLLSDLNEADAIGADFYCYHGETGKLIAGLGMRSTESHPDGQHIPARFQPLDNKTSAIMSSMFVPSQMPVCSYDPDYNLDCVWYWTKSDADQDRPN